MITKTKLAVIAALVLGSASAALATEFDANLQNRYPQATQVIEGRNAAVLVNRAPVAGEKAFFDRASQPVAGGVN